MFTSLRINGITWRQIYPMLLCLLGISLFGIVYKPSLFEYSSSEWILLTSMLGTSFVLYFFTFQLPPDGSKQSMDSAVYLACMFIYDVSFALTVLFLNALVFTIYQRKVALRKHLINFCIYSNMVISSSAIYHWAGGSTGALDNKHLFAYTLALTVYFTVNILCISIFYFLDFGNRLRDTLKNQFKASLTIYICTLILSIVLTVLVVYNGIVGLLLFTGLSILLSRSYIKMYNLYLQVEERAIKDTHTGLYNHNFFERILEKELHICILNTTNLSLAMIHIDDFKIYKDHHGHLLADQLLALVGKNLRVESEAIDAIASRSINEEFTILMPGYDSHQASLFINRLRKNLNDTYFEGVEVFPHSCLSFSAGISTVQLDIHHKSDLVDRATQALSQAKHQGKNTVYIHGSTTNLKSDIDISQDVRDLEQQLSLFLYKDITTYTHSKRVFQYAVDMSQILQLDAIHYRKFVLGALIHDIGKIELPRELLQMTKKLTSDEWNMIKSHVTWGKQIILSQERFKDLSPLIELHHEHYDGKGYPHGFKGEEIPMLCRMLTIIDSFDAMTSERPYQKTKTLFEAITEIRACAGSQFDPTLTELFIAYIENKFVGTTEFPISQF
ncbi:diguanylate cyclase [Paenibacillus antarcticus]|uniref:HD family phosphohydrolase n=1 Tax=Paenibacillus antarcticus TaxID=253703 RepID=A0A168NC34_9BACL|nr:HD domain-containing phosphohydrolase [Paenibacillus antarcticus]OAB45635.1 HD family phosphohydrolase [Paenibacillus antarcticus]